MLRFCSLTARWDKEQARELLEFAMELRCRVKDQMYRIDGTYERVDMSYRDRKSGNGRSITILELAECKAFSRSRDLVPLPGEDGAPMSVAEKETEAAMDAGTAEPSSQAVAGNAVANTEANKTAPAKKERAIDIGPKPGHIAFRENQRGISCDRLFGPYLEGVASIEIIDGCIRNFYQVRNVMELLKSS